MKSLTVKKFTLTFFSLSVFLLLLHTTNEASAQTITLNPPPIVLNVPVGGPFNDPGGTLRGADGSALPWSSVTIGGNLNLNVPGSYQVIYSYPGATQQSRIVSVVGATVTNSAPVISVASELQFQAGVEHKTTESALCTDAEDGIISPGTSFDGTPSILPKTTPIGSRISVSLRCVDSGGLVTTKSYFAVIAGKNCESDLGAQCKSACGVGETEVTALCPTGGMCCKKIENPDDDEPDLSGLSVGDPEGMVSCRGTDCSFCDLVKLINMIIVWLIGIMFVVFAVMMFVAGYGLVTSGGNVSALEDAKKKFTNGLIGIIIVLASWLIIDTVMRALLIGGTGDISGWGPWTTIKCTKQIKPSEIDYSENDDPDNPLLDDPTAPPVPSSPEGQLCYAGDGSGSVCFPAYTIPTNKAPYNYPSGMTPPSKFIKYSELTNQKISKYYSFCDLTRCNSKIGDYVYLSPSAVASMDKVTDELGGKKLTINSAYRSPAYNAKIGGAPQSKHMLGIAFDISARGGISTKEIQAACKKAGAGFTLIYDSFTHCDWR